MKKQLREFSLIWSLIFIVIGLYPIINNESIELWSLLLAISFIIIGSIKPFLLLNFYKVFIKFGNLIGGIISKIIMFVL